MNAGDNGSGTYAQRLDAIEANVAMLQQLRRKDYEETTKLMAAVSEVKQMVVETRMDIAKLNIAIVDRMESIAGMVASLAASRAPKARGR